MPETPRAIDSLMDALLAKFPGAGGLEFFGVDADSRFRRCLERANSVRRSFLVEHRPGLNRIDLISLPDSFDKFLAKYDSKKRYNLKRQLRVARESVGGDLVLERIERPDQVLGFLRDIEALNGPNGAEPCPNEVELCRDLAERGLLLGYVLRAAGRPIACLMGKEYGETLRDRTLIDPIHPFDLRAGHFGLGALELTARYSELELGGQVFTGGLADPNLWTRKAQMTDVGFNWCLNRFVKMYFDWEHTEFANPVAYRPGAFQLTNDLYWLRFHVYF